MCSGLWSAFSFHSEWVSLTPVQPASAYPQGDWGSTEEEIMCSVHHAMVTCDWLQMPSEVTADGKRPAQEEEGATRARSHGGWGLTGS